MDGQLSIFDFLGEFANMTEEEMVETVGNRLGVKFELEKLPKSHYWADECKRYEYKRKGLKLTLHYSTDWEEKTFISCGFSTKMNGGGSPCYSIDGATRYFEGIIKEFG